MSWLFGVPKGFPSVTPVQSNQDGHPDLEPKKYFQKYFS
jgi:hypothetical protein